MLHQLFILAIVFGAIAAEPAQKRTFLSSSDTAYLEHPGFDLVAQPDISSIINAICSLIGYKISAISLAVSAIEWVVSNFIVIIIGAVGALGFCKITGKCGLSYEQYIPVTQLKSLATPENLETAEQFLMAAVEKYAEKKRSV